MIPVLLAAVNACYNHTNLAVRSLALYAAGTGKRTADFREWTINQSAGEILRGIAEEQPDIVLFSTYIWNAAVIQNIIPDIKKILPGVIIGAGGPEAGFNPQNFLKKNPALDFIIYGEGEKTAAEIVSAYNLYIEKNGSFFAKDFLLEMKSVRGIFMRGANGSQNSLLFTGEQSLIKDLSLLPFPYPEITDPDNRIYYYESSRGCPFSCAYCMSSLDRRVRFMPAERVFQDIQRFLDAGVRLVKFVDRTYNLKPERYISIWKYILSHHNKKTMFHFEIEAEFLTDEALLFLKTVPPGVMQFEIGVQSTNKKTLCAVGRSQNVETLFENIAQIPRTIHSHLDLIAGLPFEDLKSFGKSFDLTMELKPDALQLGFLKILHGTEMEQYAKKNGWTWMEQPPYETLSTPYLPYKDILHLKDVETLVDAYWNSGAFSKTIAYIGRTAGFWNCFSGMAEYARRTGVFSAPRREQFWFEFLAHILSGADGETAAILTNRAGKMHSDVAKELLRFDFISAGKKGGFPPWYTHIYSKDAHRSALEQNGGIRNARLDFAYSDLDTFTVNPMAEAPEETRGSFRILFLYRGRNPEAKNRQILAEEILRGKTTP